MIYILIAIILIGFAYNHDILRIRKDRDLHYQLEFLILFLFAGLRLGMGGDTYQYRIFWETLPSWDSVTLEKLTIYRYSIGWTTLCFLLKSVFGSFISLQIVLSFLINYGVFLVAKKYCRYPFMVILMFYLVGDMYFHIVFTFIRQSASIAVFLIWGIRYLESKSYIKYLLCVAVAASFHYSGLLLLVLPFFWTINTITKKTIWIAIVSSFTLMAILALAWNSQLLTYFRILERINNGIEGYDSFITDNEFMRFINKTHVQIFYYAIILYGLYKYHIEIKFKGALLFSILVTLVSPYLGDSARFLQYLFVFFLIPIVYVMVKIIHGRAFMYLVVLVSFTVFSNLLFYRRYTDPTQMLFFYPYISCFEEEPANHRRYYNERLTDGHTVTHQIYDYNKIRKLR